MTTILDKLQIVEADIEKIFKAKMIALYKDQADSDVENFDCEKDMEQHIRGLEFRRMGCQMQLDNLDSASRDSIVETGTSTPNDDEISTTSSADREHKAHIWNTKFNIYNLKVKAIKEVYFKLFKKQYVAYNGVSPNKPRVNKAVKHWNKAIEENLQAKIKETLAVKH